MKAWGEVGSGGGLLALGAVMDEARGAIGWCDSDVFSRTL